MRDVVTKLNPFGVIVEAKVPGTKVQSLEIAHLRILFEAEHLVLLRGFAPFVDKDKFAAYCELWGEISIWPFGKVLELVEQEHPDDHIFDHSYVPLHWDGMYRPQVPEIQIFHCVSAPGAGHGGRTTFSHTARVLERASQRNMDLWTRVTGVYKRKMEYYDSQTRAPVVQAHPVRGFPVVRYCEPPRRGDGSFVNRADYDFQGIGFAEVDEFQDSLRDALYAPEVFYAHEWQRGDIVISDNYTLLHGREAFTSGAPRHLQRVQVLGSPALANPHLLSHS